MNAGDLNPVIAALEEALKFDAIGKNYIRVKVLMPLIDYVSAHFTPMPDTLREAVEKLENAERCPNCLDVGWYPVFKRGETGEQEQEQCEWCETNSNSRYHRMQQLKAALNERSKP